MISECLVDNVNTREKNPKISVVLPVYNGEAYLKSSIESVLCQTYANFELIIIDDCSTDASGEIAQHYAEIDTRVFCYRNNENLKLPVSLNVGLSKSRGEFITWTSCDNLYFQNAFEKMISVLEDKDDVGLVCGSLEYIDEKDNVIGYVSAGPSEDLIYRNTVGTCVLFRKSIVDQVGLFDPNLFLCEDYEYWLRMACVTKIYPLEDFLYKHRCHRDSLSQKFEREVIAKGLYVQKKYCKFFIKTREQSARFYAQLRDRDIYNPFRQCYLLLVLFYSPKIFLKEIHGLLRRRVL